METKNLFVAPTVSKTGVTEYTNDSINVISNMKTEDGKVSLRNGDAGKKVQIIAYLPQNLDELFACASTGSYEKEGKSLSVIKFFDKVQVLDPESEALYELSVTLTGNVAKKQIEGLKDAKQQLEFQKSVEAKKKLLANAEKIEQENTELKDALAQQQAELNEMKAMMAQLMAEKK